MDGQEHEGMSVNRQPQSEQQSLLLASGHVHEHRYIFKHLFDKNPKFKAAWTAIEFIVFLYFAINTSLAFDTGLQSGIHLAYANRYTENLTEGYLNSSTDIINMFSAIDYECSCTSSTCGLTMPFDSR